MSQLILVLNCGSSSIKYQMIDADTEEVAAKGLVEKIGDAGDGVITHSVGGENFRNELPLPSHTEALQAVVDMFAQHGPDLTQAQAVAHRTVHGGKAFNQTVVIDDTVIDALHDLSGLAPLHNPPAILGIQAARAILPDVPHVAVFDTAFFADLPAEAYTYAIDTELAEKYAIRKYGFHGTSHSYVSGKVAEVLGSDSLKQIVMHLGNGASVSAVDSGKPVDTSMGLTPLQGLVMGTRTGDIDPGIHAYLHREAGLSLDEVDILLNKQSGMQGLTGHTDFRDITAAAEGGDQRAIDGLNVYIHRLVSYIGAYWALLGGLDALTFTAGVGENAAPVRAMVVERLRPFGVELDAAKNKERGDDPRVISTDNSSVKVLVVPTNEELAMAREAVAVLGSAS